MPNGSNAGNVIGELAGALAALYIAGELTTLLGGFVPLVFLAWVVGGWFVVMMLSSVWSLFTDDEEEAAS
ncbi:hypothetical protein LCGC14_1776970 [marine sediment metagenome]|uniref:Uncharacterized protein n=1 Tax=marine sediment metagenome TaxID=412755 RepID=A0A0F9GWG9_9ZZZZ